MSAVMHPAWAARSAVATRPLQHLWRSWRSLRAGEIGWFLLLGGVIGGMNALSLADGAVGGRNPALLITETLQPLCCTVVLMLFWLPADRSDPDHPHRVRRLVLAVVLASATVAMLMPALVRALNLPTVMQVVYNQKGQPPPAWLATFVAEFLSMLMPSGLAVAALEMAKRHRRSEQAMAGALHEHAAMARAALESRLAAMQAQVEPQFLFDVLVDIERLYDAAPIGPIASDAGDGPATGRQNAAAQMERLITYLRVALPRLRESGSSVGAEVDLLASYLDLVQALRGGRPRFRAHLPTALRDATFHPMLLLPLVQRAVRSAGLPPEQITLLVQRHGNRLQLVLSLAAPGLCEHDAELQHLQDRLQVLYEGRAGLRCEELPADADTALRITCFTLSLPFDPTRPDRVPDSQKGPVDGPWVVPTHAASEGLP